MAAILQQQYRYSVILFNTLKPEPKGENVVDNILICISSNWNIWIFKYNFIEMCFYETIWQQVNISWGDGLEPPGNQQLPEPMMTKTLPNLWKCLC